MTDKQDPPPKGPDKRGNDSAGAKRPYATLDLKATEVPTSTSPGAQPADAAKPAAKPTAATGTAAASAKDDQAAAAARVAAAAAAVATSRPDARAVPHITTAAPSRNADLDMNADADAAPPKDWSSYASHAAAGIVGGLLALTGGLLLAPSPRDTRPAGADAALVQAMGSRIAALEQVKQGASAATFPPDAARRLTSLESGLAQVGELNRAIAALRESQAKLSEQGEAVRASLARSPDLEVAGRIDKLQEQFTSLAAMAAADPQSAGRIPQLAQVLGKINDLESALNTRLATLRKDISQELETRTASVAEASEAAKSGVQRLDRDVAGSRAETARIGQRVDVLKSGTDRLDQSLRMLQGDTAALKAAVDGLEGQLKSTAKPTDVASAVAPLSAKVAAIEESLQGVVRADGDRKTAAERIVLSLELGNLKRALDRGGSYAAELAAVKKRGGASFDLGALERYQHDGVPLETELAGEFRTVANAIIDADAEQPNASLMDRLLSGARTIVRVRKVTHAPGDTSTEAVVGRMELALKENRLSDVLAEAGKLSPRAAIPAQDWLKKVEARQAVATSLAAVDAALKASLVNAPAADQKGQR
ncbi:MAG: COG4223 family protein [Hyphomicrobiaceae bacterium]